MKTLVAALIGLAVAMTAYPAAAYVVAVTTSIPAQSVADDDDLDAALKSAIDDVLQHVVAFSPTFVTVQSARAVGGRVYILLLIGDDEGAATLVPLSALTVWQAFFDHAQLAPGQRVLIHGAAGGVGSFAVQIARWHGAYVIGTASAENRDFVLGLGANEVVDYRRVRFEDAVTDMDVVLDTIGGDTRERSWQVLKPGGMLVSLPEPIPESEAAAHGKRGVFFIVRADRKQLSEIARLIDSGAVRPVIAQTVPLAEAREAFERGVAGHTRGKLVLAVDKP